MIDPNDPPGPTDPYEEEDRCHCNRDNCRLCNAYSVSEDDSGGPCWACHGAGCFHCERD